MLPSIYDALTRMGKFHIHRVRFNRRLIETVGWDIGYFDELPIRVIHAVVAIRHNRHQKKKRPTAATARRVA